MVLWFDEETRQSSAAEVGQPQTIGQQRPEPEIQFSHRLRKDDSRDESRTSPNTGLGYICKQAWPGSSLPGRILTNPDADDRPPAAAHHWHGIFMVADMDTDKALCTSLARNVAARTSPWVACLREEDESSQKIFLEPRYWHSSLVQLAQKSTQSLKTAGHVKLLALDNLCEAEVSIEPEVHPGKKLINLRRLKAPITLFCALLYIKPGDNLPDTDPLYPPAPSKDPMIRELQRRSWEEEPFTRTRFYLADEMLKVQPNPFGERYEMVRWAKDPVKWDVFKAVDLKIAREVGRILIDQDLTLEEEGWQSYIYLSEKDQDWVMKNCPKTQTIELTKEFQEQLDQIRSHKFGD
ncbi:hypothetical protein AK812_SmicGene17400 [Symbiodinium microadriaticum]|uniref:Uncharacterized protein n=1 Tax=Symbiodinium microadriaticum TaxID=2951 RepID=A0A1Q9DXW8_SYMMI|nr:hypothetical protein AK812_SmicGene17400 [Symbiodinium microadriaticum]